MTAPVPPAVTWDEHLKALEKDYSQYVAVTPIFFDGALAYNVGDPVPASSVKTYGYESGGLVKKSGTKAAAAALAPENK